MSEQNIQPPIPPQGPASEELQPDPDVEPIQQEEWRTAWDGIKEFALRTRIAWRNETLHGTTGQSEIKIRGTDVDIGPILDRKKRHGLIDQERVIQGTAEQASRGKMTKKGSKRKEEPLSADYKFLRVWRNNRAIRTQQREAKAHNLRRTYGNDLPLTRSERKRTPGVTEPTGSWQERRRFRKASRAHRGLVKEHEVTKEDGDTLYTYYGSKAGRGGAGRRRMEKSAEGQTISSKFRRWRIGRLERKQERDRGRLEEILTKPEKPEEVKVAEKAEKKRKKRERKEAHRARRQDNENNNGNFSDQEPPEPPEEPPQNSGPGGPQTPPPGPGGEPLPPQTPRPRPPRPDTPRGGHTPDRDPEPPQNLVPPIPVGPARPPETGGGDEIPPGQFEGEGDDSKPGGKKRDDVKRRVSAGVDVIGNALRGAVEDIIGDYEEGKPIDRQTVVDYLRENASERSRDLLDALRSDEEDDDEASTKAGLVGLAEASIDEQATNEGKRPRERKKRGIIKGLFHLGYRASKFGLEAGLHTALEAGKIGSEELKAAYERGEITQEDLNALLQEQGTIGGLEAIAKGLGKTIDTSVIKEGLKLAGRTLETGRDINRQRLNSEAAGTGEPITTPDTPKPPTPADPDVRAGYL